MRNLVRTSSSPAGVKKDASVRMRAALSPIQIGTGAVTFGSIPK